MKPLPKYLRRMVVAALVLLFCSGALAQDRFEVGVGVFPLNGIVASAHVNVPLYEAFSVRHSLKAHVSYAFEGMPALAASYVITGAPGAGQLDRYLGAGLGLSFPEAPVSSPLISGYALAGLRVPLADRIHAFSEVVVAGNTVGTNLSLGLGVGYAFGGSN